MKNTSKKYKKRYGKLVIIERIEKPENRKSPGVWFLCRCDCGNLVRVRGGAISSGGTKSCGCYKAKRIRKNISKKRFGKLTAVKPIGVRGDHVFWLCKCDCGGKKEVAVGHLTAGRVKSCGCLFRKPDGEAALNKLISGYKTNARRRGFSWNLSVKQVKEITSQDCYYCGAPPSRIAESRKATGVYVYNGIDRVNNKIGYEIDNVVPCCSTCNWAKTDSSVDEFRDFIKRVYKHWAST